MALQRALLEPLHRWDPEQIGGFVLLGRLGAGAMGQVYLGRSAAGRLVAVKTIKVELAEEPDFRTRFGQEVAAARRVSGAFTAAVVAADSEADVPWLATMYVPAPSLSGLIAACGPLPVPAVRWLAAGCAEALESIHGAGLVHRDLKPSNVLVSPDGPRVIDFGVARAAERIQLTVTRGAVGTPAYMAPEQARDTRQATTASDVFSLGATMVYAATGHAPYQGETVMDVLVRLATESPDLTGLPGDLADIVTACLQRDPRARPTSAAVLARLAAAIGAAGQDDPGAAPLPGEALALIAEYRREPRPGPAAGAGREPDDEATIGSLPHGDLGHRGSVLHGPPHEEQARLSQRPGSSGRRSSRGGRPSGRRASGGRGALAGRIAGSRSRPRQVLLAIGAVAAAAVLMASGAAVGDSIATPPPPPAPPVPLTGPPPGSTFPGRQGSLSAAQLGRPQIQLNQDHGDSDTVFVVYGQGWHPGQRVNVALAGQGSSPDHPVADRAGTFSYAINQGHEFFPGGLPLGQYEVVVTGGGKHTTASFSVDVRPPPPRRAG